MLSKEASVVFEAEDQFLPSNMHSRFFISLSLFCLCTFFVQAQVNGGTNDKLRDLYNLGKFEDCLFKAERLTEGEKSGKDPEPYLYVSMCYFEISKKDPEELKDGEFKDPLGDALKSALKYKMKDRKNELYQQNMPYFLELKKSFVHQASNAISAGDYRKPISIFTNFLKLMNDTSLMFTRSVCEIMTKNAVGAKNIQPAFAYFKNQIENDSTFYKKLDEGSQEALAEGALLYTNYLADNNMEDSAKTVISVMYQALPGSKLVRNKYYKVWNIKEDQRPEFKNGAKVKYQKNESDKDLPIPSNQDSIALPQKQ